MNSRAYKFIVLLGIVSLFADMTYEGARSITGAYLAVLGANAAVVGIVAGFGEFIGYGLRYISGYLADKTHKYWLITIIGYSINLFAVPLLAFAGNWQCAAALIVLERMGKSIRIPARDAMLSHASENIGMGKGFGLHRTLDRIGGMLGPFIVSGILFFYHDYTAGFIVLFIPAVIALMTLLVTCKIYPQPENLAVNRFSEKSEISKKIFWIFLIGAGLLGFGFSDFALIAYHFQKSQLVTAALIPMIYGISMSIDALAAPLIGILYDRQGIKILIFTVIITAFFAPLVYLGSELTAFMGVALWAVGIGVQDSLLRSIVGNMTSAGKRGSAYGLFNLIYGAFWFVGSSASGFLYDFDIKVLVYFIIATQFLAIPFFMMTKLKQSHLG